ncbi:MAG: glycoside hydrolase family 25 protein [Prevotellaceae bacterium]|jgi:lysozyme|nr:glycoside hydrolase family 25 protein [Prevotellaceae bacterium]
MLKSPYINRRTLAAAAIVLAAVLCAALPSANRAFGIKIPKGYEVVGVDVSRYQGKINWKNIENIVDGKKKVAIRFAILKATEGRSLKDPMFDASWKNISQTKLIRGAYHYFVPSRDASEQAKNFIDCVELKRGDLPPVLDVETLGGRSVAKLRENMKIWLKEVEKHYAIKPIIYSYIDFYEQYLADDDELKDYPFWVAHYHKRKIRFQEKWFFWQFSDCGRIAGIAEDVDFNVFNGTFEQLLELCKK